MQEKRDVKQTRFARALGGRSGIYELMDDLGRALKEDSSMLMLGGGNPAIIPEVEALIARQLEAVARSPARIRDMVEMYDTPKGNREFILALVELFNGTCNLGIDADNIAISNGSQSAFFNLFNMLGGRLVGGGRARLLFPLVPEYIGYADQCIDGGVFMARRPRIDITGPHRFKYRIDFDKLDIPDSVSAVCISRPTNPSGNVLEDAEVSRLQAMAAVHGHMLVIDNAYGLPFPGLMFTGGKMSWDENTILSFSLSKVGLPALRTGILIANREVITTLARINAVTALATGSAGACLALDWVRNGMLLEMSRSVIRPFYEARAR